ncbi:hypothetical protein [Ruminococcus sp. HUN007]|uniref:hypothetical protein n=1 Tax=Ruminococcus sp. HUN007 TaxID=1514668 RepID=UPI0006787F50|nr:hypothetical protein [Ruminococcus sp. HUN007]
MKQIDDFEKNKTKVFFDNRTHFYCEKNGYGVHRYFETFNELILYRKNDLTNSDLSNDLYLNYDFSKCKTDETTKLPIVDEKSLKYVIRKTYYDNQFQVIQFWYNSNNTLVKHHFHRFKYFFDFIAFLNGDLSEADLLLCDGLINLSDVSEINLQNAMIPSVICEKFGIKYNTYELDTSKIESFDNTKDFENDTAIVLQSSREISTNNNYSEISINNNDNSKEKIFYISDLHLLHKLEHFQVKSQSDVIYIIQKCVNIIVDETENILLLGGDISSDYKIFTIFLELLKREFKRRNRNPVIIFTLGNHELWDFPLLSLPEIIKKYDLLISEHGMHLLHNNVIYIDSDRKVKKISSEDLHFITNAEIRRKLKTSRISFFGGIAFSGCNNEFNAENGIYRNTITRQQEIEESKSFKDLYDKILEAIPDKKLVVFTHTPMECWSDKTDYHKDYVYVSGHTHRNYFYDDGETRIYADNQIGYFNNYLHLKWFELDNEYDYFSDYQDGIHEITSEDYQRFYKGKNLPLTFARKIYTLYMLKRNCYYCFIHKSASGSLTILNGGSLKKLNVWNVNYYYEHMDEMIKMIKTPLDKYTSIQKKVSNEIRKIGGTGEIHGCIVDIDYYNHIYVNPSDMKLTCYWASDIINKKIFPNVRTLLKAECPMLYKQYNKLLKESSNNLPAISKDDTTDISVLPQTYLETDIYKVSREIKKMQKLSSNILTTWYDINRDMIETN